MNLLSKLWYIEVFKITSFVKFSAKLPCHSPWKFYDYANRMNTISILSCFGIINSFRIVK